MLPFGFSACFLLLCVAISSTSAATIHKSARDFLSERVRSVSKASPKVLDTSLLTTLRKLRHADLVSISKSYKHGAFERSVQSRLAKASRQQITISTGFDMKVSARQTAIGRDTYKTCSKTGESEIADLLLKCLPCVLVDEECPSSCCAMLLDAELTQFLLCEIDGCCARLLRAETSPDGVVMAIAGEKLSAKEADSDGMCTDVETESSSCGMCAAASESAIVDADSLTLSCAKEGGYDLPKSSDEFKAPLMCDSGEKAAVPGGGEVDELDVTTETVGSATCNCSCKAK